MPRGGDQARSRAANGPLSGVALREQGLSPASAAFLTQSAILWFILVPVLYLGARAMQIFRRLGQSGVEVEVLELDALAPFSHFGLRLASSLLGASAFPVLLLLLSRDVGAELLFAFALFAPTWILGAAAMVVPSLGIHAAIREAKREEQGRISLAIRGDRSAMAGSPIAHEADSLSIVELLAYRDRIAGLREWPFDARVLRQFGLTMLIPVASWVAGALVERGIDRMMGD
ncbi:MAG: hypothetical protein GY937_05045 [bacterium]|nr:hypothetical protein [bacterium]